jgi:signal transduction histidine kinase
MWGLVLATHAVWRTLRPLGLQAAAARAAARSTAGSVFPFLVEVGLAAIAVVNTGYWKSPFAFCLLTGVVAAGFSRGYGFAVRLAVSASLGVTLPYLLSRAATPAQGLQVTGQWAIELLLVAVLAGYARRLFGEAEARHSQTLDRMTQLAEANELLVSLHRVAQQLPASLNLNTVLASTVSRLKSIIDSDVTAVLLHDEASGRWVVAAGDGIAVGRSFAPNELPAALASTTSSSVASLAVCVQPGEGVGSDLLSHTGLYGPLRARGVLVGLIALEHHAPGWYGRRELQLLDGFIDSAALAVDNARWFARLRAIGADEERVRIARNMHDRLGQSLAGVAFGLDRIRKQVGDQSIAEEVDELRTEVRTAVAEVRETLGDLRTDVSVDRGMVETLTALLDRVEDRSGIQVNFSHQNGPRLPFVQEREIWRVAQEAIANAERHSSATHLSVRWHCDGQTASLAVADDGAGFLMASGGRADSYGLRGMQERADAVGATLEIDSAPGSGTVVRCRLGTP